MPVFNLAFKCLMPVMVTALCMNISVEYDEGSTMQIDRSCMHSNSPKSRFYFFTKENRSHCFIKENTLNSKSESPLYEVIKTETCDCALPSFWDNRKWNLAMNACRKACRTTGNLHSVENQFGFYKCSLDKNDVSAIAEQWKEDVGWISYDDGAQQDKKD